jgi:hypothetical protein
MTGKKRLMPMVIKLDPNLEAALTERARQAGVPPDVLALQTLRDRFLPSTSMHEGEDEWVRRLRSVATDCGVSLSDEAVSSEGIYE